MKFTIDRSKWLRGDHDSRLLRASDGKMCCIGQVCKQLGVADEALRGRRTTVSIEDAAAVPSELSGKWVREAYDINDNVCYSDAEREARLQVIAASAGHEFEFIN